MAGTKRADKTPAKTAMTAEPVGAPLVAESSVVPKALDAEVRWDDEPPRQTRRALPLRRRAWRFSLLLAVPLCLALLAAVQVDRALSWALRTPTVGDEASAACDYLLNGNYAALAGEMDPAPDGASTAPFDRAAFVAGLHALDTSDGRVTSCTLSQLAPAAGATDVIFSMTVRRAQVSYPLGSLVVVRTEADGRLRLSRASTFYYQMG